MAGLEAAPAAALHVAGPVAVAPRRRRERGPSAEAPEPQGCVPAHPEHSRRGRPLGAIEPDENGWSESKDTG